MIGKNAIKSFPLKVKVKIKIEPLNLDQTLLLAILMLSTHTSIATLQLISILPLFADITAPNLI
jgi:hypothetical protein